MTRNELEIIEDHYEEKLKEDRDKEKDSFSKYKYNQKIRMLEEIKELKL